MVARVATFEGINVEEAQKTMDEADAIIRPLVEGLSGYAGSLDLATRDGKFVSITLFDSMESAEAAEETFDKVMPEKLGHIFETWGGRRTSVDRYELLADRRR
jgi:hypothetical protein